MKIDIPQNGVTRKTDKGRLKPRALVAYPLAIFIGSCLATILTVSVQKGYLPFNHLGRIIGFAMVATPFVTVASLPVGLTIVTILDDRNVTSWSGYGLGGAVCINFPLSFYVLFRILHFGDFSFSDTAIFFGASSATGFIAGVVFWAIALSHEERNS